jgi:4-hydroxybenzoate polyprenyltransferase
VLKRIGIELLHHIPFTAMGAVVGIAAMAVVTILNTPVNLSETLFFTFHPLHVVFSALVTTAIYRKQKKQRLWLVVIVGYVGSVGIATLSDAVIPFLEGSSLKIDMAFHLPFLETEIMPFFGIPAWIIVNAAAAIGIAIGFFKPNTRFPHMGHVLLSTWASLFGFTAFGTADWLPLLPIIFVFLFLAVWIPCCVSDIVFPLLWTGGESAHEHSHH